MKSNELSLKKNIKLIIKNNAFRVAHKLAIRKLKTIVKNSSPLPPFKKKNGKKIIFNMIYGMYGQLIYWECGLAKAMQMRGHDVKILICGKALTMCTTEYTIHRAHNDKTCKHCVDFTNDFLKTTEIPFINFQSYISKEELDNINNKINDLHLDECKNFIYKGVSVGALSVNSAVRYFKGAIDINNKFFESILRAELINSLISIDIAEKIIKQENPDILVTTHLGYSSWGSFADYCELKGIRVTYPGGGYKKNTIFFDFRIKDKVNTFFKLFFENVKKKQFLSKIEEKELDSYIYNRVKGKEGDTKKYSFADDDITSQFDLDANKKTFALFPNVPWDSSLLRAHRCFKDVNEWISYTIKYFKQNPDYQLIVKIHPSETYVMKSENTVLDFIIKNFSPISENIKIIPPNTKISPYSFFSLIDTAIVYNGTIGLEMALNRIPVIVTGITHYGNLGFTYDIISKGDYLKILSKNLSRLNDEQIKIAKLYGYFYFIKSFVPYNIIYNKSFLRQGWNFNSFNEIKEGKNKYLDIICDYIANNKFYQKW